MVVQKKIKIKSVQFGFTLIELLLVFAIAGSMTALSVASFWNFNNNQIVQSAALDVGDMLNVAKSRSVSQVKPAQCDSTQVLNGYRVSVSAQTYQLEVVCGGVVSNPIIKTRKLPRDVVFGSAAIVFFNVSTGDVQSDTIISVSGYGRSKLINIDSLGNISIVQAHILYLAQAIIKLNLINIFT